MSNNIVKYNMNMIQLNAKFFILLKQIKISKMTAQPVLQVKMTAQPVLQVRMTAQPVLQVKTCGKSNSQYQMLLINDIFFITIYVI